MPSSRFRKEKAVMLPRWKVASPACNSARESLSTQILSAMVTGRLRTAFPQSPCPPGCMDTEPSTKLRRATRFGGSLVASSSSARAGGANKTKTEARHAKIPNLSRLVNLENAVVFMITNPLFSEGTSDLHQTCWEGPSDGKPNTFAAPILLNPKPGKKLPYGSGCNFFEPPGLINKTRPMAWRVPSSCLKGCTPHTS